MIWKPKSIIANHEYDDSFVVNVSNKTDILYSVIVQYSEIGIGIGIGIGIRIGIGIGIGIEITSITRMIIRIWVRIMIGSMQNKYR